jgi:hypothetical protein
MKGKLRTFRVREYMLNALSKAGVIAFPARLPDGSADIEKKAG